MFRRFAIFAILASSWLLPVAYSYPPDPHTKARALLRDKKFEEAVKELESYLATNRYDGSAWSLLGVCRYEAKQYDRAIAAGQKAIEIGYRPAGEMYNIACCYALSGKADDAIVWLKKSFDAGFAEQQTLETDADFATLRKDLRFIELTGLNPPGGLSPEKQWTWDLDFLVRRMEQMHWRLYAKVSRETFRSEIDKLKADAPKISNERARVRLSRILAMVGDGHTTLASYAEGQDTIPRIPLHLHIFGDGLYVLGAPSAHQDLVGAKVLKVGSMDTAEAMKLARPYGSVDNEMGYLFRVPARLVQPAALQEIGALSGEEVEYTLQWADGSSRAVKLSPVAVKKNSFGDSPLFRSGYVYANAKSSVPPPLYQRDLETPLTMESLPDQKAVYFGFHAVAENNGQRFGEFVDALMKRIDEQKAENLIIDMRLNGGGNTGLVQPLITALLKNERINKPGHLFVIIGHNTFSAAQNTVNLIETLTNATFVGEPTGSRPAFVGESTHIVMPYSKLRVYCSSRYWQVITSTDRREWVQPQIAAELTFKDFVENRDPCLEAITRRLKGGT